MTDMSKKSIKYLLNHICIVAAMQHCDFNTVRTANHLDTTQPNVSKKIKQFEEYMGKEIFARGQYGHYIGFTPAGKQIFLWCEKISESSKKLDRLRRE